MTAEYTHPMCSFFLVSLFKGIPNVFTLISLKLNILLSIVSSVLYSKVLLLLNSKL